MKFFKAVIKFSRRPNKFGGYVAYYPCSTIQGEWFSPMLQGTMKPLKRFKVKK